MSVRYSWLDYELNDSIFEHFNHLFEFLLQLGVFPNQVVKILTLKKSSADYRMFLILLSGFFYVPKNEIPQKKRILKGIITAQV